MDGDGDRERENQKGGEVTEVVWVRQCFVELGGHSWDEDRCPDFEYHVEVSSQKAYGVWAWELGVWSIGEVVAGGRELIDKGSQIKLIWLGTTKHFF